LIAWLRELLRADAVGGAPASGRHAAPPVRRDRPSSTVVDAATIGKPGGPSETLARQLALVIDLNVCVGCHACVTSCKEWNTSGSAGPLVDENAYGANPTGTFFNRVQSFEAGSFPDTDTIHFPKSCLHCEEPPCVPVCPTGASYKRKSDGIVLVDYDKCIGCKYCAWACPYGARELDEARQVMTKCTLCVDRIHDESMAPEDRRPACVKACPTGARLFGDVKDPDSEVSRAIRERGGYSLMPEWDTKPANQYLPRRVTAAAGGTSEERRDLGEPRRGR
jgi:Fe-S-cluster-containing dehydrogenase component